ncbi:MAG: tetratricopeptide repeat protein [Candidatus Hodarchaeales archaeon]
MKPSEVLSVVEQFVAQGNYDKALANLKQLEKTIDLTTEERIDILLHKLQINLQRGEYKEAYAHTETALDLSAQLPIYTLDVLFKRSHVQLFQGKAVESLQTLDNCEEIITTLNPNSHDVKKRKAHLFFRKGQHFVNQNNLTEGSAYIQKSIALAEEINAVEEKALSQFTLGAILWLQGDLDNAIENYQQAMAVAKQFGLKYYIGNCLVSIGEINYWKGNYGESISYYHKALSNYEAIDGRNSIPFVVTLFMIITVLIDIKSLEEATSYFDQIVHIEKDSNNAIIKQYRQLAEGIILKQNPRIKEKVKAQELFKKLITNESLFFDLKVIATLNYCEILIEELKLYGAPEVLKQVKSLITELHETANNKQNPQLMVQSLLLKTKLLLVEGNLEDTEKVLLQAREKAAEIGLTQLENKINHEIDTFHEELSKWTVLVKQASLIDRLEEVQIKKYIRDAQKIIRSN